MYALQKNKKQTEELNSSQIKEILLSFYKSMEQFKRLYHKEIINPLQFHIMLDRICQEAFENITSIDSLSNHSDTYPYVNDDLAFEVQSGTGLDLVPVELNNEDTEQNVAFIDTPNDVIVSIPHPMQYTKLDCSQNVDLGNFLQRPVQIFQHDWSIGASIDMNTTNFRPWHLFFNKPSIKRKLDNYYLLRCNLHLKFVINASPFYYGAVIAAYEPLMQFTPAPVVTNASKNENVSLSQRPHVYLYPANSQGGEIVLPFLYHKNWLDATSSADLTNMGEIAMSSFGTLRNANGVVTDSVSIVVYAWAEDIEISGPTIELAVQSDEYEGKGVISKPASAIARSTKMLSKLPIIGPFATATSYAAGAVADIASLFGYTNVPVIDDVKAFRSKPYPNIASTDIGTPVEKLTLDAKNELSIDPKISGANVSDELMISDFVGRESFFFDAPWSNSDPIDHSLFFTKITPNIIVTAAGVNETLHWPTPCDHVARCFRYWRGDMIFRFKIICTKYHKGRIRVNWDPKGGIGTNGDYTTEVYTKIIDISAETDVEFRIPYTQQTAYLETDPADINHFASSSTSITGVGSTVNGILTLRVLNALTSPITAADISILCFVRGADNLEFACPKELPSNSSYYKVQSESYDLKLETINMGETPSTVDDNVNLIYMGETIPTLRQLMRRTSAYMRIVNQQDWTNASQMTHKNVIGRSPIYPGYDPAGVHVAVGLTSLVNESYNWVNWSYTTWFSPCFVGARGAYHYTINPSFSRDLDTVRVTRTSKTHNAATYSSFQTRTLDSDLWRFTQDFGSTAFQPNGLEGMSITNQISQAGLMVSVPMYSIYKFLATSIGFRTEGNNLDNTDLDSITIDTVMQVDIDNGSKNQYNDLYMSVGTDFSLVFFLNVPTRYEYNSTPVAPTFI